MNRRNLRFDNITRSICLTRCRPAKHFGAFPDRRTIPPAAILIFQKNDITRGVCSCRAARIVKQHERQQRCRLALIRDQTNQQPSKTNGLSTKVCPDESFAGRGGIASGEDQIDGDQHRIQQRSAASISAGGTE